MNNCENKMMHAESCECLAWKPIFAGALVAIGLTFLLNLFSISIGLTAFSTDSLGVEKLAFGGLLGTAIGIIASMFAAGWLAGYLGRKYCNKRHMGALYGFLTWSVALVAAFFLVSHAQQYVSFYSHFISGTGDTFQAAASSSAGHIAVKVSSSQTSLIISSYIVFCLFFLSAFSSSLGGHCGMRHRCKKEV